MLGSKFSKCNEWMSTVKLSIIIKYLTANWTNSSLSKLNYISYDSENIELRLKNSVKVPPTVFSAILVSGNCVNNLFFHSLTPVLNRASGLDLKSVPN